MVVCFVRTYQEKNASHQSDKKSVRPSKRLCRISSQKKGRPTMKGIETLYIFIFNISLFVKVSNIQVTRSLRHHLSPRILPKPQIWAHLGYVLSTGSRDHHILHRDVRQPAPYMRTLEGRQNLWLSYVFFSNRKGLGAYTIATSTGLQTLAVHCGVACSATGSCAPAI